MLRGQGLGPQSRKESSTMSLLWKEAFTLGDFSWSNTNSFSDIIEITDLEALKHFLDAVHVKF